MPDLPSPGWYADPADSERLRWWTGRAWTNDTRPAPPPAGADPASRPGLLRAAAVGVVVALVAGGATWAVVRRVRHTTSPQATAAASTSSPGSADTADEATTSTTAPSDPTADWRPGPTATPPPGTKAQGPDRKFTVTVGKAWDRMDDVDGVARWVVRQADGTSAGVFQATSHRYAATRTVDQLVAEEIARQGATPTTGRLLTAPDGSTVAVWDTRLEVPGADPQVGRLWLVPRVVGDHTDVAVAGFVPSSALDAEAALFLVEGYGESIRPT